MSKNILSNFGHNLIDPEILDIASVKQDAVMSPHYLSAFYIKSRYCISSNMLTLTSFVPHMSFSINSLMEHGNHISSIKISLAKKKIFFSFYSCQ